MYSMSVVKHLLAGFLILLVGNTDVVPAGSARSTFYQAYYTEQAEGDWAAAAELYEQVAADRRADAGLRSQAKARLGACREELASTDFARLMPPEAWAYVEIKRPGDQLVKLLEQLGLLAQAGQVPAEGERRVAISPALIKGLSIGGAAAAITGFNIPTQTPYGVLVFHPGDLEVVRGLIETGLPVGGQVVEPIGGFATYNVEGQAFVTLTSRLVVVSTQRSQIQEVIDRLSGAKELSLASSGVMGDVLKNRDDSLLLFFVNAKAFMPHLKGMMGVGAMANHELAMAQAVLDIESFHSLMGNLGVSDDGLFIDFALRLDEGHHNLVYNFLRTPAINPETLKSVPEGVAGVFVGALNESVSRYGTASSRTTDTPPIVTALDLGREVFANITTFAVFALPPDGSPSKSGPPIPDVAAVITVNDPAKSEALWTQALSLAALATGVPAAAGSSEEIEGVTVHGYRLPENITIYFATSGNDVLIATSKRAMVDTLGARGKGSSILNDEAFAASVGRLTSDSTQAIFAHAGRCAAIAKQFMSERDLAEAGPVFEILSDTSLTVVEDHSGEVYRVSTMVSGIPDIGDFVAKMLTAEYHKKEVDKRLTGAMRTGRWDEALGTVDAQLRDDPGSRKLMEAKFKILATGKKDHDAALAVAEKVFEKIRDDAKTLNTYAWRLLTKDQYGDAYNKLALKFSERSNELTDYKNWMYVDTLALAKFKTGDAPSAVELEKKAIELCGDCWGLKDMKKAVTRFETGAGEEH
ncbi:MAG: DUF3352 domain-containing protein [Phycisphaerales bacterium]|nr:MAG: DUF3352 domain-containing protein [Phycisphaerales bacterium]